MGKTLRVCLAMGGGVSLGSYSGAGLTEALKLLLLYGQDKEGKAYDEIIVDGMSGASAGAISLGILLRCLVDYESMMKIAGFDSKAKILKQINETYDNPSLDGFSAAKKNALLAIEVSQKIQHLIWVKKVTAEALYGEKASPDYKMDKNQPFGLLERNALEALAKELILPNDKFDSSKRALLDPNRILFALSLTNLAPMPVGYDSVGDTIQEKNLLRSTASSNHAELRVIDFVFQNDLEKPSDDRWVKFIKNPSAPVDNKMCYDLDLQSAWATLTSTSLACGAFPLAFAPVMLKRFKKEYDSNIFETDASNTKKRKTSWPGSLMQIRKAINSKEKEGSFMHNSFFGERGDNILDYESFNFAYIDGGTFNNEPIKEAFKIASFQDFRRDISREDRLVLFVDPIVRKSEFKSFRINSYAPVASEFKTYTSPIKGELSKLFGLIDPILGALVDQGSIKEDQKINGVSESLSLREILFNYLDEFSIQFDEKLIRFAYNKIKYFLDENMISIGTRDAHLYIIDAIEKECETAIANDESLSYLRSFKKDLSFLLDTKENSESDFLTADRSPNAKYIDKVVGLKKEGGSDSKNQQYNEIITRAVFKVLADLALGTAGKNPVIDKRVILPVTSDGEKIVDLPGHNIAAFAGFASQKAKEYAFEYARLNATMTLAISDEMGNQHAYLPNDISRKLENKSKERLGKTGFYNQAYNYQGELEQKLVKPGIDRIFTILKTYSSKLKSLGTAFLVINAFVFSLIGLFNTVLKKIKKRVVAEANTFTGDTQYQKLKPITISIISKDPIKLRWFGKIQITTEKGEFDLKMFRNEEKKEVLFSLYLLHGNENQANQSAVALTASSKIKLPTEDLDGIAVDPNLNPNDWEKALLAASPPRVKDLQLHKNIEPISMDFLKDTNQSLYYSLCYAQFHINPMLQYNLDTKSWSFIENTKSFEKELVVPLPVTSSVVASEP